MPPRKRENPTVNSTVMVNINRSYQPGMKSSEIMDVASGDWPMRLDRAQEATTLLAAVRGVVVGEFKIKGAELEDDGRVRFTLGMKRNRSWVGEDVSSYYQRGAAHPVRYLP